jgi:fumarate hydratase class II
LAYEKGLTLREAALKLKYVSAEDFDKWVRPEEMVHPD